MKFRNERAFTDAVIDLAKMNGWRVMHMRGNTARLIQGHAGFPDLVLVRPPHLIFAELKVGRNVPTPEQQEWLDALTDCEVEPYGMPGPSAGVYAWRPEQWDAIVKVLGGR